MERKKVQSSLSVAWQVLVLPAIFCAILFIAAGTRMVMFVVLPLYLIGAVLTFPRKEWYGGGSPDA